MARNGSGTYFLPPSNPVVSGTVIESDWANDTMADLAAALTQSIAYDGQTVPIANLPMGGFHHTNVSPPSSRNQYATLGMVQDGLHQRVNVTGGVDNIVGTLVGGATAYVAGSLVSFFAPATNTGAMTLNYNGIGARSLTDQNGLALTAGEIQSGEFVYAIYTGTEFRLLSSVDAAVAADLYNLSISGQVRPPSDVYPALTIATGTTVNVPAGSAWIVPPGNDTDEAVLVTWAAQTITMQFLSSSFTTFVMVDETGVIQQIPGRAIGANFRHMAVLGVVEHITGTVNNVITRPSIFGDDGYRNRDAASLLANTVINGALVTPNSISTLNLDVAQGTIFIPGGTANVVDSPNTFNVPPQANISFRTVAGQALVSALTSTVPVGSYDANGAGVIAALPNPGDATVHRLFYLYGQYLLVYGQQVYTSVENALSMLEWDRTKFKKSLYLADATLLAEVIAIRTATNLNILTQGAVVCPGGLNFSIGSPGGIAEAPIDGFPYGRRNAAWFQVLGSVSPMATVDATITGLAPMLKEVVSPANTAGTSGRTVYNAANRWYAEETVWPDDKTYFRSYNPATGALRFTTTYDLLTGGWAFPQNINMTGVGSRFQGNFSSAHIDRTLFQTNAVNNSTSLGVIPNGTATSGNMTVYSKSDPTNSAVGQISIQDNGAVSIVSGTLGTGTAIPLNFVVGGVERARFEPVNGFFHIGLIGDLPTTNFYKLAIVTNANDSMGMFTYNNIDGPIIHQFRARGSQGAPLPVLQFDTIGGIRAGGRNSAGAMVGSKALMTFYATGNWTGASNPTAISWQATQTGAVNPVEVMRVEGDGAFYCHRIEVGSPLFTNANGTSFIDFHTSAPVVDYDTRILSHSPTGGAGGGKMDYIAFGGHIFAGVVSGDNKLVFRSGLCEFGAIMGRQGASGAFSSSYHNWFWNGAAIQAWVDNTNVGTLAFTCDYRTKKDVEDLPSMWDAVKRLRPIKYTQADYTPEGATEPLFVAGTEEKWSFLAHELQETLVPSAASGYKDAPDIVQAPDPMVVIAALTKALQEAMGRIEDLEAKLDRYCL